MAYDHHFIDPYAMMAGLPYWLINQWEAWYLAHNLIGDDGDPEFRSDMRLAKGFATVANHLREKDPLQINDLLPFPSLPPGQTDEQLHAALSARADRDLKRVKRQEETRQKKVSPNGDAPADDTSKAHAGLNGGRQRGKRRQQKHQVNRRRDGADLVKS